MVFDQYRQIKLIKNALDVMEANLVVDMTFSWERKEKGWWVDYNVVCLMLFFVFYFKSMFKLILQLTLI